MADWLKPTITSNYVIFVDEVKNRDLDAITLQLNAITNPPNGAIKLLRAPVRFQEWDSGLVAFRDLALDVSGGGTGSNNQAGARTNLGLGTMAVQNSNAIAVTGGSIANLTSSGTFNHTGAGFGITGTGTSGNVLTVTGNPGQYTLVVIGASSGISNGIYIAAGATATDAALLVHNRLENKYGLRVMGDMVVRCLNKLVVPVGVDLWA